MLEAPTQPKVYLLESTGNSIGDMYSLIKNDVLEGSEPIQSARFGTVMVGMDAFSQGPDNYSWELYFLKGSALMLERGGGRNLRITVHPPNPELVDSIDTIVADNTDKAKLKETLL